jgi:hypothetical protein
MATQTGISSKEQNLKMKRERQNIDRKIKTLLSKAFILGLSPDVDVAVWVFKRGRWTLFRSNLKDSFPPNLAEIVCFLLSIYYTKLIYSIGDFLSNPKDLISERL